MDLSKKTIQDEVSLIAEDEAIGRVREVPGWRLTTGQPKLQREFHFADFKTAMKFVNEVAEVAEHEGHHPDIHIHYDEVMLVLWTHSIGGLSENDFIMAAKLNEVPTPSAA